jgi:hypothetical protein
MLSKLPSRVTLNRTYSIYSGLERNHFPVRVFRKWLLAG